MTSLLTEIVERVKALPDDLQQQVLHFVRSLGAPSLQGIAGTQLLKFAGFIPQTELQQMWTAIERDTGRVDLDEW